MKSLTQMMNFALNLVFAILGLSIALLTIAPSFASTAKPDHSVIQNKQNPGETGGSSRGGGKYGDCEQVLVPLTALVPYRIVEAQPAPITYVGGITTSASPTLWFYVPYQPSSDLTASFVLKNAAGETTYQVTSVDLTAAQPNGIVSVSIPNIDIGQTYHWYFKVNCEARNSEVPIYVDGGIQRNPLDPQLASQLATLSPLEQAERYQQKQLWYDAITILGNLRRDRPTDPAIESAWDQLLRDGIHIIDIP